MRIHAGKVAALVKVAVDACEAEVAIVVRATVFEGAYVFDVKSGQGGIVLMGLALLAAVFGTLPQSVLVAVFMRRCRT